MTLTGCDILGSESCRRLEGRRTGLLANPASVTGRLVHTSDLLTNCGVDLACIFGPQHGLRGETQANMIEWQGYTDPRLGIPVYSLYGKTREPFPEMLDGLEVVLIDLQDVGARPYTYIWTATLMMRQCARAGVKVLVLDRPNPLGGKAVEGPLLRDGYFTFVGMHPMPMRHGLTIGEALSMINGSAPERCDLEVIAMKGWARGMHFVETGLPWVMPSPNMPTTDTAAVYPGSVLFEATNISEGRGTTRPFELIGAPWIDPAGLSRELSAAAIEGVVFREADFRPAWDKHAGELCGGVQIHVTDRGAFRPLECAVRIMETVTRMHPGKMEWLPPPYEYEEKHMPVDILYGGPELRESIDSNSDIDALVGSWKADEQSFIEQRRDFLLYRD